MARIIPVTGNTATLERQVLDAAGSGVAGKKLAFSYENGLYVPYKPASTMMRKALAAIGAISLFGAPAAAKAEGEFTLFGTTPPVEVYNGIHGTTDSALKASFGGWTLNLERNRDGGFDNGQRYAALSKTFDIGTWSFEAGTRVIDNPTDEAQERVWEGALFAKRQFTGGETSFFVAYDSTDFGVVRGQGRIGAIRGGVGVKITDAFGERSAKGDWFAGYAKERFGAFLGKSTDGPIEGNLYARLPLVGPLGNTWVYAIHKDFPGQKEWSLLWAGAYGAAQKASPMFGADVGEFTVRATTDQVVHPFLGPLDSVFSVDAPVALELARVRNGTSLYVQGTAGGRVLRLGNGIELYAGASLQWRDEDGATSTHLGGEARLVLPVQAIGTTLALDYRLMPGPGPNSQLALKMSTKF